METYRSERWPTRDRVIPFRLFAALSAAAAHVAAGEQLQQTNAVALGRVRTIDGKNHDVKSAVRALERLAEPKAYPRTVPADE